MTRRLERLELRGFRGSTSKAEFNLDSSKRLIMVFGENGTGKSSLVDAIDFVCNGLPGPIGERRSTPVKDYLPALGVKAKDLAVALTWGGQQWNATLDAAGRAKITGPGQRPSARILRRSQLLRVIEAQPSERYKELSRFIDVSGVEKAEGALRAAYGAVNTELDTAAQSRAAAERELEALWKAEGSPPPDPLKWAERKASADVTSLQSIGEEIGRILEALNGARKSAGRLNSAQAAVENAQKVVEAAERRLGEAEALSKEADRLLLDLLQASEAYLTEHPEAKSCPVCEQPIEPSVLKGRLASRRAAGVAVSTASKEVNDAKRTLSEKTEIQRNQEGGTLQDVRSLGELLRSSTAAAIRASGIDWGAFPAVLADPGSGPLDVAVAQGIAFLKVIETLEAGLAAQQEIVATDLQNHKLIWRQCENVRQQGQRITELSRLKGRLEKALQIVEGRRKKYVETILNGVAGRLDVLYRRLHPDEKIGDVKLELDAKFRGSLHLSGSFETADRIPPQAYYSDSHLDTLGICIFLALAERYAEENTIVVLDDVLNSTDQSHLDRFVGLIHDECAASHQVVITTHYRPWRDRYRFARGPTANVQLIELLPWSHSRGVRHTRTKLEIDELEVLLAVVPVDRQALASRAGVLLESLLDRLTVLYRCRLPRKPDEEYTLGELLSGIDAKLRKALKTGSAAVGAGATGAAAAAEVELKPLIERLESLYWIRSRVGAHFSEVGMDITDGQVVAFSQCVRDFLRALVCESCGELPRKSSGSVWNCGCSGKWLSPLTIPGAPVALAAGE